MLHCLKFRLSWGNSSLPVAFGLIATKQLIDSCCSLSPTITVAFMTQQLTFGQNCIPSQWPRQLMTRQWHLTKCKSCSGVWGHISWHEILTHHSALRHWIQENCSHYDFSCWVIPKLFHGINTSDWMISAWDSSSCFLPTNWQHKCKCGCSYVRVIFSIWCFRGHLRYF